MRILRGALINGVSLVIAIPVGIVGGVVLAYVLEIFGGGSAAWEIGRPSGIVASLVVAVVVFRWIRNFLYSRFPVYAGPDTDRLARSSLATAAGALLSAPLAVKVGGVVAAVALVLLGVTMTGAWWIVEDLTGGTVQFAKNEETVPPPPSATTITPAQPTTTTTQRMPTSPNWQGKESPYQQRYAEARLQREQLITKVGAVPGGYAQDQAEAIMGDLDTLATLVNAMPWSPPKVRAAQDAYWEALMDLRKAAQGVHGNDSRTNVDRYNEAWSEEYKHSVEWSREYMRSFEP